MMACAESFLNTADLEKCGPVFINSVSVGSILLGGYLPSAGLLLLPLAGKSCRCSSSTSVGGT